MLEEELIKRGQWQKLCYLSLAYDAASRKSECHQTLKQIDFEKNETTIVRGKGGKKFTQPFSDKTAGYMKKWLEVRGEDDCDKLFIIKTKAGKLKPISKGTLNGWCKYFSKVYKELTGKDEWIYPHCFKSNRLSNLYNEDSLPLEIVQEYGHHNDPSTTLNNYIEKKPSKTNAIVFKKQNEESKTQESQDIIRGQS
jgi:integrase